MDLAPFALIQELVQTLYEKKAKNVIVLDIKTSPVVTDYLLIADGNVEKHVIAMAHALQELMKKNNHLLFYQEGIKHGDWVVLDFFEIVVHLFIPKMRQKYQLERLWAQGKIMNIESHVSFNMR